MFNVAYSRAYVVDGSLVLAVWVFLVSHVLLVFPLIIIVKTHLGRSMSVQIKEIRKTTELDHQSTIF